MWWRRLAHAHTDVQPATGGKRGASEKERGIYIYVYVYVYTRLRQATRYTRELMPLTHRSHLPGLSYGDIFDRAIIPNTIYTARARRDARVIRHNRPRQCT